MVNGDIVLKLEEEKRELIKLLNETLPYIGPFSFQSFTAKKLFNKIKELSNS